MIKFVKNRKGELCEITPTDIERLKKGYFEYKRPQEDEYPKAVNVSKQGQFSFQEHDLDVVELCTPKDYPELYL